jgi:Protein of unknown function (DUF2711)
MDYSQYSYPNYETPLIKAYDSRFSAAFIALHPFFRMPTSVGWKPIAPGSDYPDDIFIRQYGQPEYWQTIMQGIGCEDLRRFYIGMRTWIGALNLEYRDEKISGLIYEYTQQAKIYSPIEGRIEPLMIEPIAQYISHDQSDHIFYLPEFESYFPEFEGKPEILSAEATIQKCGFLAGSLFDVNITRLATVDWDDFFTVIYGSSDDLASFLETNPLEGFFCDDQTLHTWCWQERSIKPAIG